ncbi:hypothetical protein CMUST_13190 [Corynebacterium mustelae]|uniref:Uncharacterized protein n=1 Tax=Corynebacterium mustelae TaxID=571915 RepID=A0A0G3H6Z6_9CORY|nr:hypothetical protein [Corynebacterium mustelae]AKK06932.1 hypothetical protein CMUST_13190 [Corynebacterium mustelae]
MAIDSLFFPTFHADISLFDAGVSRFEDDPYFYTARMEWAGVEYVLVMQKDTPISGFYPQLRFIIVDGVVSEISLRWQTYFSAIDGVALTDADEFVDAWNDIFDGELHVEGGNQIWNADYSVVVTNSGPTSTAPFWDTVTWFNLAVPSQKRSVEYFLPGRFDDPRIVQRYLDDRLWGDLQRLWPEPLDCWVSNWPGIHQQWPGMSTNDPQWLEALHWVMTIVYEDGRFEVYDELTGKTWTTLEQFTEESRLYIENDDMAGLRTFTFIYPSVLQLRPFP